MPKTYILKVYFNKISLKNIKNYLIKFLKGLPFIKKNLIALKFQKIILPKLTKQLVFKNDINKNIGLKNKKIILPLIETSHHYEIHNLLGLAKALEIRGAEIKILVCGETLPGCELKSAKNYKDKDPCWSCRFILKNIVSIYGFEIYHLSDFISKEEIEKYQDIAFDYYENNIDIISHGVNLNQSIQDSVIRYYYGAVPKKRSEAKKIIIDHAVTALISINAAFLINNNWKPDLVLNNMSSYSAWEPIFKYFKSRKIDFHTITTTPYNFNVIDLNFYEIYQSRSRFKKYLKFRKSEKLDPNEKLELDSFIQKRFSGNSEQFKKYNYFDENIDRDKIKEKLNLNEEKRNIFLFTNLYWDVGMADRSRLYGDVILWVTKTIEFLQKRENVDLYIKTHPAEKYDSSNSLAGVKDIILEKYPILPSNVKFIDPELKFKPYDLFPFIDVGILFDGTLGLEMLLSDIPVIDTGNTPYNGLGFSGEPKNEKEYQKMLMGKMKINIPDKDLLNLFCYFYFISCHISWTLTDKYFGKSFDGFNFDSLDELIPGKDPYLDHLCNCIINYSNSKPDNIKLN